MRALKSIGAVLTLLLLSYMFYQMEVSAWEQTKQEVFATDVDIGPDTKSEGLNIDFNYFMTDVSKRPRDWLICDSRPINLKKLELGHGSSFYYPYSMAQSEDLNSTLNNHMSSTYVYPQRE
jgi:hypothetical protein